MPTKSEGQFRSDGRTVNKGRPADVSQQQQQLNGAAFPVLIDTMRKLAYDGVAFLSVVNGVPEDEHEYLAEHLTSTLFYACYVAPVEAARVLTALLLTELDRATQRRNDVHTFMRGSGLVPRVVEGLLGRCSSALANSLAECCALLCEKDDGAQEKPEDRFYGALLRNAMDRFTGDAALLSREESTAAGAREEIDLQLAVSTVLKLSHRIADTVDASAQHWPWSLRRALHALLLAADPSPASETPTPTPLQQNMLATIIVLRAVVPALLGVVGRLLPAESCFDRQYVAFQRRCTLLARLAQKAAHGLCFSGSHERAMADFNAGLVQLSQRWVAVFARLVDVGERPTVMLKGDHVSSAGSGSSQSACDGQISCNFHSDGEAVARGLCAFLDEHAARLVHASIVCRPLLEPLHVTRILGITRHGKNETNVISTLNDGSVFSELLAYAAHPPACSPLVNFCGIAGVAQDGSVVLHIQTDLLRAYVAAYYGVYNMENMNGNSTTDAHLASVATPLEERCPRFAALRRASGLRDGDALAFLFYLIDVGLRRRSGGELRVLALKSELPFSGGVATWLHSGLQLLPPSLSCRCAAPFVTSPREALSLAAEWRVCIPIPCVGCRTLLADPDAGRAIISSKISSSSRNDDRTNGSSGGSPRHWPTALMRDVLELLRGAAIGTRVPPAATTFCLAAVELFARFDGDLLLYLELGSRRLLARDTIAPRMECLEPSWFESANATSATRAHESGLMRLLLLFLSDTATRDGTPPPVMPSVRHVTLESLWRILLYNLWSAFAHTRQVQPSQCPVTAMARVVRSAKGKHTAHSKEAGNIEGEIATTTTTAAAAAALAKVEVAGREHIQLLVSVCEFVQAMDYADLGGGGTEETVLAGVRRIAFHGDALDEAQKTVVRLIALHGPTLLHDAGLSSWEGGLLALPGLPN